MNEDQIKLDEIYRLIQAWKRGEPFGKKMAKEINMLWALEKIEELARPEFEPDSNTG